MSKLVTCVGGLLALVFVLGCGPSGPELVPVSGQVLIDGEPVKNASLTFAPENGRSCYGRTDDQGRFSMTTYEEGDGCMTGTHRVEVSAVEYETPTDMLLHVPDKYMDLRTSDVTVTIDGATDDLELNLTWDGQKGPIRRKVNAE